MKIAVDRLRAYLDLPEDAALRPLFDDCGLEVKRATPSARGLVLTLELLANRGDHRCYAGVAREVATRLRTPLRLPEHTALTTLPATAERVRVETKLCLSYTLTELARVGEGTLDEDSRRILEAAGSETGLLPVDATILAGLELGQPTHVFDAARVVGPVTVRLSRAGERAWPLFAAGHVDIPAGTLVIADTEKILAIAGVIGCEDSKTTAETTHVLLESATFDPPSVRIAARALGLSTDASGRFERGGDPTAPVVGAGRVVHLLEASGAWKRVGDTAVAGEWTDPARTIALDLARASAFLGIPLDAATASDLLGRYGFGVRETSGGLVVRVPGARLWDVEGVADLYEELAKAVGYNTLPTGLPPIDSGATTTDAEVRRERVEEILLSEGFFEVVTNGFYSRALLESLGVTPGHPLFDHVETTNALDRGYSLLKNNALAQAVETVATNVRLKNPNVRAFEWTRTFHLAEGGSLADRRAPCTERGVLWMVMSGPVRPEHWSDKPRPVDLWYVKGLLDAVATELRLPLRVVRGLETAPLRDLLHPHRQGAVLLGDAHVGTFGEVHPSIVQNLKLRQAAYYLELDAAALLGFPQAPLRYEDPPAMPPMHRQLTFNVPSGVEAGAIAAVLRERGPAWFEDVRVIDLYEPPGEAGVRALTFDLQCTATRERSADDVNRVALALIEQVEAALPGVKLRV